MFKRKNIRDKKKPIESFDDEEVVVDEHKITPVTAKEHLCDCGKPAEKQSHQCWACAHRA